MKRGTNFPHGEKNASSARRSLADIVGPWQEPGVESGLIARMRGAWSKPIKSLTNHELATCLRQKIALGHVLPISKQRVIDGIDDGTEVHDTELADAVVNAGEVTLADQGVVGGGSPGKSGYTR